MQYKSCYLKNSAIIIYLMIFAYFFAPAVAASAFEDGFYIFAGSPTAQSISVIFSGFFFIFVFYLALSSTGKETTILIPTGFADKLFFFFWVIFIIFLIALLLYGIKIRLVEGPVRSILLEREHDFFIMGTGQLTLVSLYYISVAERKLLFVLTAILFVLLDLTFMGKIFIYLLVPTALFRYDVNVAMPTYRPILIASVTGVFIVFFTFMIREFAAIGELNSVIGLYSFFSEFIGVFATVDWADLYKGNMKTIYDINAELQLYYIDSVGHGLALHPVAYFISLFGGLWFYFQVVYSTFLLAVISFFNRLIGGAVIFVLILNFQHFVRHGPDIFLKNILIHCLVLYFLLHSSVIETFIFRTKPVT